MRYFILSLILWCAASLPAFARCTGTDVRDTFTQAERSELTKRVAATVYAEGNHWTATRDDTTIHLIGTIHMFDRNLAAVGNRLKPIVQSADLLLVEATQEDQKKLENAVVEQPDLVFLTTGPTLPELLDEEAWQSLKAAAEARGIPGFMAAKFQPWYLSLILSMPSCALQLAQSGLHGMDYILMSYAAEADVPQRSLESTDTIFKMMGADPLEKQVEYLRLGTLPDDVAENALATMFAGYYAEQTAEIMEFSRILARRHIDLPDAELDQLIDEFFAALLDERNKAWIPVILNAEGQTIVVAAGAGHLPGEFGLVRLLENEGFTLTRQPF